MAPHYGQTIKTTILLEKELLYDIDQHNPFPTRREFLEHSCRAYLNELKRKIIDEKLANACSESSAEDVSINEEWEAITLEGWK